MNRREFCILVGGTAAAWPVSVRAQQAQRPRTVFMVLALDEKDPEAQRHLTAFRQELQKLGWTIGGNLQVEYRWGATNAARAASYADEVANLKPDLILAHATLVTRALVQKNKDIPVIFTNVSDPLGEKFVESFARPGANVTGFTNVEPTIGGKYLEYLKEVAPGLTGAVMLFNPKSTPGRGSFFSKSFEAAGSVLSVQTKVTEVYDAGELEKAIAAIPRDGKGGLVVVGEPFTNLHRARILDLAAQYRLPTMCPYRFYAAGGCLISYGVDFSDQFRRTASYVDRVLKGDLPANLAVQSPVKFELVINLKTAKSLGLTVPPRLHFTADEVIE